MLIVLYRNIHDETTNLEHDGEGLYIYHITPRYVYRGLLTLIRHPTLQQSYLDSELQSPGSFDATLDRTGDEANVLNCQTTVTKSADSCATDKKWVL